MKKTIRICSKEWDLKTNPKGTGAEFNTYYPNGRGSITIGTKWKSKQFQLSLLLHEILEAILTVDQKRFNHRVDTERENYVFVFDHNYMENLPTKILDALISCGVIKIGK